MFKNRFNFNCACFLYIKLKFNILYRFYHTFFQQLYLDDVFVTGILREKIRMKLRAISKMRSVFYGRPQESGADVEDEVSQDPPKVQIPEPEMPR